VVLPVACSCGADADAGGQPTAAAFHGGGVPRRRRSTAAAFHGGGVPLGPGSRDAAPADGAARERWESSVGGAKRR